VASEQCEQMLTGSHGHASHCPVHLLIG
jgi:hypothetical protein